jgi:lipoprotein NlpD
MGRGLALAGLVTLAAAGCASAPPTRERPEIPPVTVPEVPARSVRGQTIHTVAPGETLWRISKRYGTSVDAIMAANGIKDVRSVATGARLVVPITSNVASARRGEPGTYASRDPRGRTREPEFSWPVRGEIMSGFGKRHSDNHDGIDIRAGSGTVVRAAESGRVIHADASLAGYGKMIVIKHAGRLSSVYAHNRKLLVEVGQFVEKGEPIAEVGETGNATTPHLHFEIRSDGSPRNPLDYLQ